MKKFLLLACFAALGGCAVNPVQYQYMKQGGSPYDRTTDLSQCQYQIQLHKVPAENAPDMLRLCMQGKGWRLEQVSN
ncbi:hypothetical protein [Thiomonas sp.]|uniref:hypothetical protein n=1 Tax=Thiomonas sp. TaxID=2047785 RepID=UPI00261A9723|nr:hypothetical protein [Thiomonas sp.]